MSFPEPELSPIIVLVTTGSDAEAKAIARLLVEQKLAACVNILPIQSVYRWNDEIQEDAEYQLLIKTDAALFSQLEEVIKSQHQYELPEIIAIEIQRGSSDYLGWLNYQRW